MIVRLPDGRLGELVKVTKWIEREIAHVRLLHTDDIIRVPLDQLVTGDA